MIEEIVRGTLLELLERNLLVSWPSNAVVKSIVKQLEAEDDDREPLWKQEWYDWYK